MKISDRDIKVLVKVVRRYLTNKEMLSAPCILCGYNGPLYWQKESHYAGCGFHGVGGEKDRGLVLTALLYAMIDGVCDTC